MDPRPNDAKLAVAYATAVALQPSVAETVGEKISPRLQDMGAIMVQHAAQLEAVKLENEEHKANCSALLNMDGPTDATGTGFLTNQGLLDPNDAQRADHIPEVAAEVGTAAGFDIRPQAGAFLQLHRRCSRC